MEARVCTSCSTPHLADDWYEIEEYHPREGQIECRAAHEDRVRREVRDGLGNHLPARFGHVESRPPTAIFEDADA